MKYKLLALGLGLLLSSCGKTQQNSGCTQSPKQEWMKYRSIPSTVPVGRPFLTDGKFNLQLYQIMKDIHELFQKHNITYWIEAGTLLGAVRHQGIIPWDDDVDVQIAPGEEAKLLLIEPELNALGYDLIDTKSWGYWIKSRTGDRVQLDVFLTREDEGKIFYVNCTGSYGYREGLPSFFKVEEVYPLKDYQFGLLTVKGPNNPKVYFTWLYGEDHLDKGYDSSKHFNTPADFKSSQFHLTDQDRLPAMPLGPLEDRVK